MNMDFIARTKTKEGFDISVGIIEFSTIKANESTIQDLLKVIELLKQLGYTIDS